MEPRETYERRPYQRRSSNGPWIGLGVAAVLAVVAFFMFREQEANKPPPTQAPTVDPEIQRRIAEQAVEEKERQRQQSIQFVRQQLERIDRQIASNQERLKDPYSWSKDRDKADAKELAAKRAKIVEKLAGLGEEP